MELLVHKQKTDDPHFLAAGDLMTKCRAVVVPAAPPSATPQQVTGQTIALGIDAMLILSALAGEPPEAAIQALSTAVSMYAARTDDPARTLVLIEHNAEVRLAFILAANLHPKGTA